MPVLIEVRNAAGLVGRCDSRCYEAKEPECNCICGGANHGKGKEQARANTQKRAKEWLAQFRRVDKSCYVPIGVQQPLFTGEEDEAVT